MRLFLILSFSCLYITMQAQQNFIDSLSFALNLNPREKVYVHTDREEYASGDFIWLKAYLVKAGDNNPITDDNLVYVDLIDAKGRKIDQCRILVMDGCGHGSILLPDTIGTGNYTLIGHTNYLRNFGHESFFQKNIVVRWIPSLNASTPKNTNSVNALSDSSIDFQFLPEGGYLSLNLINKVAFKAIGPNGRGIEVKGRIYNQNHEFIDSFASKHLGMGYKLFLPRQGNTYYAILNKHPLDTYALPQPQQQIMMRKIRQDSLQVTFLILDAPNTFTPKNYFISIIAEGTPIQAFPFNMNSPYKEFTLPTSYLSPGVNRITLYTEDCQPISNRLVFNPYFERLRLEATGIYPTYKQRKKTSVQLHLPGDTDTSIWANCSMSVINVDQLSADYSSSTNIISSLLLSSDLKGYVEDAASYFQNPFHEAADEFDLVLLTHGWQAWHCTTNADNRPVFPKEQGISVSGKAYNLTGKRSLTHGEVTLIIPDGNHVLFEKINPDGSFEFKGLKLYDSMPILVQAIDQKGKTSTVLKNVKSNICGEIQTDSNLFHQPFMLNTDIDFVQKAYLRQKSMDILHPDQNMKYIDEVVITASHHQVAQDVHTSNRRYSMADNVIVVGEDAQSYHSVLDYLEARVPGVSVNGDEVSIRNMGEPLFLIDGIERGIEVVSSMSMSEIDLIEVLKSPSNLAVFGVQGGNGVIAIYTRRGENAAYIEPGYGAKSFQLKGYSATRNFYAPRYDIKNETDDIPDHRATVYWNPSIIFKGDTTAIPVEYFNADDRGIILLQIEGISSKGHLIYETFTYRIE